MCVVNVRMLTLYSAVSSGNTAVEIQFVVSALELGKLQIIMQKPGFVPSNRVESWEREGSQ